LAAVPFAALYDRERGRYVIEDVTLRFATGVMAGTMAARPGAPVGRVLMVADPAFAAGALPGLARLGGAAAEVRDVARFYPRATMLVGAAATKAAFARTAPRAWLVHYAGHAIIDDDYADRSHLVLAAPAIDGEGSDLSAGEIERMDLRRVRLVILSACETAGDGRDGGGGLAGMADAFLIAGAAAVVGTQWRVDDQLTRPMMVAFHGAYRATGDGPGALRNAQLLMRRSSRPTWRSPAAWAAFRYLGR
jgi:CHAT domain-containing protein